MWHAFSIPLPSRRVELGKTRQWMLNEWMSYRADEENTVWPGTKTMPWWRQTQSTLFLKNLIYTLNPRANKNSLYHFRQGGEKKEEEMAPFNVLWNGKAAGLSFITFVLNPGRNVSRNHGRRRLQGCLLQPIAQATNRTTTLCCYLEHRWMTPEWCEVVDVLL